MELPGASWARSQLAEFRTRPFGRLCRHFLRSLTQSGQESEQLEFGAGALLALLAVPGALTALSLLDRYSSFLAWLRGLGPQDVYLVSVVDKYFFIVLSMTITGVVAVFKWDRILPTKQDYFNFAPLPIRSSRIYLASLAAAMTAAAIFAVDVNAASTVLFPMVVMASVSGATFKSFAAFVALHAFIVVLASLFTFFACFGVMTVALALLPASWFARISVPLRVGLIVGLLTLLVTNGVVPNAVSKAPDGWLGWLPPVWFVALYQKLQGSGPAALLPLAERAWMGLFGAMAIAALASWLGYHRYFRRIPEMNDGAMEARRGAPSWLWRAVPLAIRRPVEQGVYGFSLRVLMRSETHTLVIGGMLGLGLLLAIEAAIGAMARRPPRDGLPSIAWMSVPLILSYSLAAAVRFSFELPAVWKANWIFAYLLNPQEQRAPAIARKILLTVEAPLVLAASLAFGWYWSVGVGLTYGAFLAAATAMLVELLVVDFRKVPFTCSLPPFRNDTLAVMLGHLFGFALFSAGGAQLAGTLLRTPLRFWVLATVVVFFWGAVRFWLRESAIGADSLQFTARQEAALQTLDLADRA
jgi:hypothetical protein